MGLSTRGDGMERGEAPSGAERRSVDLDRHRQKLHPLGPARAFAAGAIARANGHVSLSFRGFLRDGERNTYFEGSRPTRLAGTRRVGQKRRRGETDFFEGEFGPRSARYLDAQSVWPLEMPALLDLQRQGNPRGRPALRAVLCRERDLQYVFFGGARAREQTVPIFELEQRFQREVPRLRAVRRARHEPRHFLYGVEGLAGELAAAGSQRETREGPGGGAGGRGSGLVEEVPTVHEERLVPVPGEREARAVRPSEARAHRGDRGDGFVSPHARAALVVRLVEIEKRVGEKSLVLEKRGNLRDALLPRALKPSLPVAALLEQKARAKTRRVEKPHLVQDPAGDREARDGERVPARDSLVVEGGRDAARARREERGAHWREPFFGFPRE